MSERTFRLVQGIWLLAGLLLAMPPLVYALLAVLLFEGLTNLRVPLLVSRLRGMPPSAAGERMECGISFEAERALRLIVVAFLALGYLLLPQWLWWFPWFIAFALIGAGLSGICPMVMALRWVGFG